ncbi:hypothetical protein [Nocardia acidivorans]|nr:hypothetical protein [Nocardia acidivorans]
MEPSGRGRDAAARTAVMTPKYLSSKNFRAAVISSSASGDSGNASPAV